MPAKPGKGGANVVRNYKRVVGKMTGPRTESAMAKVLSIGMTGAKELAPLEYGPLINSAFRRTEKTQYGLRGVAGFAVGYAIYLHQNPNWSPRPPDKKTGPAWNPNATPKFLERGFTDKDQIAINLHVPARCRLI
jgi:hypothetical protein